MPVPGIGGHDDHFYATTLVVRVPPTIETASLEPGEPVAQRPVDATNNPVRLSTKLTSWPRERERIKVDSHWPSDHVRVGAEFIRVELRPPFIHYSPTHARTAVSKAVGLV